MALRGDRLLFWRRMTGERLQRVTGVAAAAFRPDGALGGILRSGQVFVIAPETGAASVIGGEAATVRRAVISPRGDLAAYVDGVNLVVLDMATGRNRRVLAIDAQDTLRLFWAEDGRHLGATDFDLPRVRIWRLDDGSTITDITPSAAVNRIWFGAGDVALIDADDVWRRVDLATGAVTPLPDGDRIDDALIAAEGYIVVDNALGPPLRIKSDGEATAMGEASTFGLVGLRAEGHEVLLRGSRRFALPDVATGGLIRQVGRPSGAAPAAFHMATSGDYLAILDEDGLVAQ
jgi:hypothetical protein